MVITMKYSSILMLTTLSLSSLTLTGCVVLPGKWFKPTTNALSNSMNPSDTVRRTETSGSPLCDSNTVCPEFSVDWRSSEGQYNLYSDIFHINQYDIQKINFNIDGQNYSYTPTTPSNYRKLQNSSLIDSTNYVTVPRSFLTILAKGKTITMTVNTNQGDVSGALLDSNQESGGYKVFMRGYKQ